MGSKPDFVELVLTCGSWQEAQRIADTLLEKYLVACVKFIEVESRSRYKAGLQQAKEVTLLMESVAPNFAKIEREVAKLHSYETFVLHQLPITNLSVKAKIWLEQATTPV